MYLRTLFTIFIIFTFFQIFWYGMRVSHSGKTKKMYKLNPEKRQTKTDCLNSLDACPACYEPKFYSADIIPSNISCAPSTLFEYNATINQFRICDKVQVVCPRNVRPAERPVPKTALLSWPGSGNTWTRHLIQQLTGIETGAVYLDKMLKYNGFPGEGKLTDVIVVKTHSISTLYTKNFTKQILVLRNPFDALVAEYKRSRLHARHAGKTKIVPNEQWASYVEHRGKKWASFVITAIHFPKLRLIVVYEDMKNCLLRELLRISAFLRTSDLSQFSACCALLNSVGRYYRNQGRAPLYELYNDTLRDFLNDRLSAAAAEVGGKFPVLATRLLEYRLL